MQSNIAPSGMAVTPHHLASESALSVLRHGGDAIEAMVAAAATIAVVYPHMNGIGGDGFWLIVPPEGEPLAVDPEGQRQREDRLSGVAEDQAREGLSRQRIFAQFAHAEPVQKAQGQQQSDAFGEFDEHGASRGWG